MAITLKNDHDIAQMRVACRLASEVLDYITPFVTAGITTGELDRLCHEYMLKEQGTVPAPLNYQPPGYPPYPKATCISVNDVICHGIPGDKTLKNGDALNIDITVIKEGYFGDTSRMFIVG
jgi:methionyl aminopeptidase